jgi:hypothetical protein
MPSRSLLALTSALCVTLLGCGPSLVSARDALAEGRLPAAAADLRALEPGFAELPSRERARYALYRGVVELGLGNAEAADRWLFVAWRADRADPKCFDEREHGELMAAWRSTGRLPGEAGARPASAAAETLRTAPRR